MTDEFGCTRRGGRTQRMLDDVECDARAGRYVFVWCGTEAAARRLRDRFAEQVKDDPKFYVGATKVYVGDGQVAFEGAMDAQVLATGLPQGAYAICKSYMDHGALEHHAPWALRQWVEYANPFLATMPPARAEGGAE